MVIIGSAIAAAAVTGIGGTIAGLTAAAIATNMAIAFASSLVMGGIAKLTARKPKGGPPTPDAQERTVSSRQAIAPRRVVYGEERVGGVQTFMHSTDSSNHLNVVYTLTGHEVAAIPEVYFDDQRVTFDPDTGIVSAPAKWANVAVVFTGLGSEEGDANLNAALTAEVTTDKWGPNHRQTGCAKLYVRFGFSPDLAVPNVSALVRGRKVLDPRTGSTGWTNNWALIVADYLTNTVFGLGDDADSVDQDALIAAANICEEQVAVTTAAETFTVDGALVTLDDTIDHLTTGDGVTLASGGTLPTGLAAGPYYWHRLTETTGYLCATYADAMAGIGVAATDAGSGLHSLTRVSQPRYACNGSFLVDQEPADVLEAMARSAAGKIVRSGATWVLLPGAWRAPTVTFDEDDLDGPIRMTTRLPRSELANGIRGTFVSHNDNWQATSFPPVTNAAYVTEDQGEEFWKDLPLAFTHSHSTAQRVAKIQLETLRRQLTVTLPLKLTGLLCRAGDVVMVTNARYGWTEKTFEVAEWSLAPRTDDKGTPYVGIDLTLRETDAAVYDWSVAEEQAQPKSPYTTLPDPSMPAPPSGFAVTSNAVVTPDGIYIPGLRASWTAADDATVTGYEVQWRLNGDPSYTDSKTIGDVARYDITPLAAASYDVRVRALRASGAASDWVEALDTAATGDNTAPDPPSPFTATVGEAGVDLAWTNPSVGDYRYTKIYKSETNDVGTASLLTTRYALPGSSDSYWDSSGGTNLYYWAQCIDASGNAGTYAADDTVL